jgi:hypothetical protein
LQLGILLLPIELTLRQLGDELPTVLSATREGQRQKHPGWAVVRDGNVSFMNHEAPGQSGGMEFNSLIQTELSSW